MPKNLSIGAIVAVIGFIVLLIGSLGYMGVFALDEIPSGILMGIGIVAVIGSMIAMMLMMRKEESETTMEE